MRRYRNVLLWTLAGILAGASLGLPRLLNLNDHYRGAFLTAEAYAMSAGLLLSGFILGAIDPKRAARWGVAVGMAPLLGMIVSMTGDGPGNLWPVAIVFSLLLGLPPATLGAFVGMVTRRRCSKP